MMIEIKAKLIRDSGIYAHGERVECVIEFIHLSHAEDKEADNSNEAKVENLAWASVQLHCYRKASYGLKAQKNQKDKFSDISDKLGKTALDSSSQAVNGDIIVATKPKILFCDLALGPGDNKKYVFEETIPRDGPPTYKGHDIRYFYKITVATQRLMSKVHYLTIPIRVLPIPIISASEDVPCTEETNAELTPTNPFMEKRDLSELELSWHYVNNLTARRAPKHYRISNKHGFVTRFCLYKPHYKLGEQIVGSLDFDGAQVKCIQYSVKLQCQELQRRPDKEAAEDEREEGEGHSSGQEDSASLYSMDQASVASGSVANNLHKSSTSRSVKKEKAGNEPEPVGKISSHAYNHEVSYAMVKTFIMLPIPLHDLTPTFQTDLVDVRWRLHFEFVTSTMKDFGAPYPGPEDGGEYMAPEKIQVETMSWDLPIILYAANPLQISSTKQIFNLIIK